MPAFQYNGEPDRYYPSLAITPVPGEHFTFPGNPGDGRWSEVDNTAGATQPPVDLSETDPTLGQVPTVTGPDAQVATEPLDDGTVATPPATDSTDAPAAQDVSN